MLVATIQCAETLIPYSASTAAAITGPLPLRWIALDLRGNRRLGSVQHTPKHHTRVFFSSDDRQSNFPKALPHINHLQCEASEKTKPSTRQEAEEAGEQRDRGKIQNAKLMQQVHLQQQGPARGRRRRPRWRKGRQQQASWLSCFGVISIKEWIEGQRRTNIAQGRKKQTAAAAGREAAPPSTFVTT